MVEQLLCKHKVLILSSQYCQGKKKRRPKGRKKKIKVKVRKLCFICWSIFLKISSLWKGHLAYSEDCDLAG
jgi:hypothetical protein